jgi:hypothetical protein
VESTLPRPRRWVGEAVDARIDRDRLDDLIDCAVAHETNPLPNDDLAGAKRQRLRAVLGPDADARIVGPFTERGRANGLVLRRGRWHDEPIVADGWISRTTAACDLNPMYGYLWWLQHDQSGRQVSLAAQGGGSHHCFVIPDHELVVVARWIGNDAWPQFIDKALAIVTDAPSLGPVVYDSSQVNTVRPPISELGDSSNATPIVSAIRRATSSGVMCSVSTTRSTDRFPETTA